ncbi:S41 family peptidase [Dysgonomonas sp. Marseille-P4677]|uniref:S41 family peptidase n=1 Tax=Dysgonomonas sp. Marseille-P4677 TaxID=2364790 RepID=UPI001913EF41|nr:S41 family peptidase [Dysgonomonas sp. Marseille-P4677]MBK5720520.1 S41 family peptidase [Dysgonomonas sp. Marseille-P4677]
MKSNKGIYVWLPLCIALSIAAGIFIGNVFSVFSPIRGWIGNSGSNKLETIFDYINKSYVDTVNVDDLMESAIPTIIAGLDPHSTYISAENMELTGDELEGHFSGIGVEFMLQSDTVVIVNIVPGGPSEAVGIIPGDRLVYVNDSLFVGKGLNEEKVFRNLRGKKDTKVKLDIKRGTSKDLISFEVTRADVPVKTVPVSYIIDDKVGYIKVTKFGSTTYNEFITAIAKLKSQGCESFIVDLQGNTGGYMGAAIMMTNEFLPSGNMIVYTEGRAYPRENVFADGSGTCKENQLVVLIDEGSASASEIFSGAMQDNDRGLIVGRRSFGKGLVQSRHVFRDGSALQLTIARYHTPSGRCIQKAYKKGDRTDYDLDLVNRYNRGEFDNRDSIKLDNLPKFQTLSGRPVYGDDGILADVFVPRDTIGINSYYLRVANSGALREYAFSYTEQNRELFKKYKTWQEAERFLATQPLVDNLVEYAYGKGIRRQPYLIQESRKLLQTQIASFIIRNLYGEEGFYSIFQKDDSILKEALNLIKANKATVDAIKEERYK